MNQKQIEKYRDNLGKKLARLNETVDRYFNSAEQPEEKVGGTVGGILIAGNRDVEYVYYTDINKIIARLRLLLLSQKAGNDIHTNEIDSILNELSKKRVIRRLISRKK